jgi:Leucine-rich repeat (LRR) protein
VGLKTNFMLFLLVIGAHLKSLAQQDSITMHTLESARKLDSSLVYGLDLSRLKLDSVPSEINRYQNLKKLDLGKNKLNDLPDFMSDFLNLEYLNLEKNKFATFPLALCQLPSVKILILNRNDFTSMPDCLQYMKGLEMLELWDTPLANFPESITLLPNLKQIDIYGIQYSAPYQQKWKEKLPHVKIIFSAPCDCLH